MFAGAAYAEYSRFTPAKSGPKACTWITKKNVVSLCAQGVITVASCFKVKGGKRVDWLLKIGQVGLTSIASVVVLFLLTKLMGEKQISQLNMFDYIVGITIGSIAAEMATEVEKPFYLGIVAMAVYAGLAVFISIVSSKSVVLRKYLTGRSLVLMDKGKLYRTNLKKAHLDLSEFLTLARMAGYYDITQVETAVLECNGAVSFLPRAECRPVTPSDLNLSPLPERPLATVIMDGHILQNNLKMMGQNEDWLLSQLKQQGYHSPEEVFLATCDEQNQLSLFPIQEKKIPLDKFE